MREIFKEIETWRQAGKPIALATNVKLQGASLRPLGAKMAVSTSREIAGSVTGGCIEGAVYDEAQEVIREGRPKILHYGIARGEMPWEVGLSCGGTLDVLLENLASPEWKEIYPVIKSILEQNQVAAVATLISASGLGRKMLLWPDGHFLGSLGSEEIDGKVRDWSRSQMALQEANWCTFQQAGEVAEVFLDVLVPPARLIIIGAVHLAIPLVSLAKTMGFKTIVIDPRSAFTTRERFPVADELVVEWPSTALEGMRLDECTYIAAISHDEKLDNPALKVALSSRAGYIGALGSRKKIPQRLDALRDLGVTKEQLKRLHVPIGIKLGAIQAEEIALSILAEIVAVRHGVLNHQETQETLPVSEVS